MTWLAHAFAVDPPGPAQPTETQRLIVDRLCREVVQRRMTGPALLSLELSRPLTYVSAQALHFFQPFLTVLMDAAAYDEFAAFLEQRGSIDYICGRLETLEANHEAIEASRKS